MGDGIDLAAQENPEHAAVMENFRDQLIIVLMKRLAGPDGKLTISISECDDTASDMLAMGIDQEAGVFNFHLQRKN